MLITRIRFVDCYVILNVYVWTMPLLLILSCLAWLWTNQFMFLLSSDSKKKSALVVAWTCKLKYKGKIHAYIEWTKLCQSVEDMKFYHVHVLCQLGWNERVLNRFIHDKKKKLNEESKTVSKKLHQEFIWLNRFDFFLMNLHKIEILNRTMQNTVNAKYWKFNHENRWKFVVWWGH